MINYYIPTENEHDRDLGTPAAVSERQVTVAIDGKPVTVPEGTSLMRAASMAEIDIPKLCATDSLKSFGSCRICLVEIEGRKGYPASCTTPVEEGMTVSTESDKLSKLRGNVIELYLSDQPEENGSNGDTSHDQLQLLADALNIKNTRYGRAGRNHLEAKKDISNPYFRFDPSQCILCSRCVRACDQVQGTFALTVEGRGFESRIVAGQDDGFMDSDCVSCGACVSACPTPALIENSVLTQGAPAKSVVTTCAYCGVGCAFKAEITEGDRGDEVVRMSPYKGGKANRGHSCVKGRFAYGFATHEDRITAPMIRDSIHEPWREVSWEEAITTAARRLRSLQQDHGVKSIAAISSSRCTNEETFLVQKLVRAVFTNNNIDTCARVCHSPTGYGLKQTLGESAGTQDFDSVEHTDLALVIGANPTDSHPVFASRLRRRLREGAQLIVADPREIDLLNTPHGPHGPDNKQHLKIRPGSNVAFINAMAHVIVTEGLEDKAFIAERCEAEAFEQWRKFIVDPKNSPEAAEASTGIPADELRRGGRCFAAARNAAIYYGLGVTEHSQGSTMVMGIANLAMLTGNIGRPGVGVNPLRGQNNVQGSCDMGNFPHELPGYRPVGDDEIRGKFEDAWGLSLDPEPGLRIPQMFNAAIGGTLKGLYCQGEDVAQSDPNTQHVEKALRSLDCLIVQDLFLNETAKFAHIFLPGASFLEKDGTFTNAERRVSPVRKVMEPQSGKADWEVTCDLARAMGYAMDYKHPSEIMAEIALLTPTFAALDYDKIDSETSIQWPCTEEAPEGTPVMHATEFVRGKGKFIVTEYVPTTERTSRRFPLLLTTGRILSQYNVGSQTRRTENMAWHDRDLLDIHALDAEDRGIRNGDTVSITSRAGETVLRAHISERMQPGVVYTTFHHPESGSNVITTDNADWATSCPEYKVTAVEVSPVNQRSKWQEQFHEFDREQQELLKER
jgi:formate dehydrogenase major subunit